MENQIITGQLAFAIAFFVGLILYFIYLFIKPERKTGVPIMRNMPPPPQKKDNSKKYDNMSYKELQEIHQKLRKDFIEVDKILKDFDKSIGRYSDGGRGSYNS